MADPIYPVQKLIYLTDEQFAQVKDFKFSQRLDSDNEAIRRLIALGLEAARQRQKETAK
jgi:hypothetical protein